MMIPFQPGEWEWEIAMCSEVAGGSRSYALVID